ncbi:unnamed protein product [Trichogramma brassicae]|uniref:Uncharacterized protein n=1 Tax=Trichogramma brassicae TaxID=86971 RepID=A0A6H5HXD0_9HYME|nr:unnamed protein product [Trichogramma brassicae]
MKPYYPALSDVTLCDAAHHRLASPPSEERQDQAVALSTFRAVAFSQGRVGRLATNSYPGQPSISMSTDTNPTELGEVHHPDCDCHIHLDIVKMPMVSGARTVASRIIKGIDTPLAKASHWPTRCPTVARALFAGWISLFCHTFDHHHRPGRSFRVELLASSGMGRGAKHVHTTLSSRKEMDW